MVNIPSDLRKNKETIIGNMNLRECVCLFLGIVFSMLVLYYLKAFLGYKNIIAATFISELFLVPFLILGFKQINGMKIDDYIKVFINNKILSNSKRVNISNFIEPKISNKKYELIRYYRLVDKRELIILREYLLNKNGLILTEFVDYKNISIVIFRLDGKNMILEKIEKNKKAIENKNNEILDYIKRKKRVLNNGKKNELNQLYDELKKIKEEKKYLQSKTFNDLKNEVNIFENLENVNAERIFTNKNIKIKNSSSENYCEITNLIEKINNDDRNINELHLFDKSRFKNFFKSIEDKIIFINNDDKVDIYVFGNNMSKEMVDLTLIDRKETLYKETILRFNATNLYNHYRKINNLMEII